MRARAPRPCAAPRATCPTSRRRSAGRRCRARGRARRYPPPRTPRRRTAARPRARIVARRAAALAARREPHRSRAVFSSVCCSRISRSSFGSRPTSDSTAPSSSPAASARIDSMTADVSAVDSTRCPGGSTTRMLNWRGSAGGSSSVPSRSSDSTATAVEHGRQRRARSTAGAGAGRRSASTALAAGIDVARARRAARATPRARGSAARRRRARRAGGHDGNAMPDTSRAARPSTNTTGRNTTQWSACSRRWPSPPAPVPLAAASSGGSPAARAEDALHDDDRVVDEHAGAQREPAECHDVQALAGEAASGTASRAAIRGRRCDDDGRPRCAQEQEQNADRERDADERGRLQLGHRVLDECGFVGDLGD